MCNCGVYFSLLYLNQFFSILYCQATAVWNCRGLDCRRCCVREVPAPRTNTKEQAPGECCTQSDLDTFLAWLVQCLLVLVRREERERGLPSLKCVVERIEMLSGNCCVRECTFFFLLVSFLCPALLFLLSLYHPSP